MKTRKQRKPGPYAARIRVVLELAIARDHFPPTMNKIGAILGVTGQTICQEIKAMMAAGELDVRVDAQHANRRCYHLIDTGKKTRGFDEGVALDEAKGFVLADYVLRRLTEAAAAGEAAPTIVELAQESHVGPQAIRGALKRLWLSEKIDMRMIEHGGLRAYRIEATGATTKGFDKAPFHMFRDNYVRASKPRSADLAPPKQARVEDLLRVKPKTALRERRCMTCQKPFMSEGAHNRMCVWCRSHAEAPPVYRVTGI